MTDRIQEGGLQVARVLHELLVQDIAPGTGVDPAEFWSALEAILNDLAPRNKALLAKRDELQASIDAWHRDNPGADYDRAAYKAFLQEIGYLLPEGEDFTKADAESADAIGENEEILNRYGPGKIAQYVKMSRDKEFRSAQWNSMSDEEREEMWGFWRESTESETE